MATKSNIMGLFDLFRKKTPEEVLRKKIRDGFNATVSNTLKRKLGDPLLDELSLKAAIGSFYQAMKNNHQLHVVYSMFGVDSPKILEEELKYVLNKWIPNHAHIIASDKKLPPSYEESHNKKQVASSWKLKSERYFTQEEIDAVSQNVVISSQYGNSVEFVMRSSGTKCYIPLDKSSNIGDGEVLDMTKAKLLTFEMVGENDIIRIKI